MKDFKIEVKFIDDPNWHTVTSVSFRFWKNPSADGINELSVLGDSGVEDKTYYSDVITDVRITIY